MKRVTPWLGRPNAVLPNGLALCLMSFLTASETFKRMNSLGWLVLVFDSFFKIHLLVDRCNRPNAAPILSMLASDGTGEELSVDYRQKNNVWAVIISS